MSAGRRLGRLEARAREAAPAGSGAVVGRALRALRDEDLETLAAVLDRDDGPPDEPPDLDRLYENAGDDGRRALDALFGAMGTSRKGGRRWG